MKRVLLLIANVVAVVVAAEQAGSKDRPATDSFLLVVAVLIGISIGLALPFFLELARGDIEAERSTSASDPPLYTQTLIDEVEARDFIKVDCLGGREFEIAINKKSTCGDVVKEIRTMLDLGGGIHEYRLFTRSPNEQSYSRLENTLLVHTSMLFWEHQRAELEAEDSGISKTELEQLTPTTPEKYRYKFNIFAHSGEPKDAPFSERDFQFESAADAVLTRRIPCTNKELVKLAAQRLQFLIGDAGNVTSIPSDKKVHPVQEDGNYTPLDNTTVDGANRLVAKASKKRVVRGGRNNNSCAPRKMTRDDVVTLNAAILSAWKALEGISSEDARNEFMETVKLWHSYHATLYDVKQVYNSEWPSEVWVLIGHDGVALHEKHSRVALAMFPYHRIHSFGAPLSQKYKVEVDGEGTVEFVTKQVSEITELMKLYIAEVTRNRAKREAARFAPSTFTRGDKF